MGQVTLGWDQSKTVAGGLVCTKDDMSYDFLFLTI